MQASSVSTEFIYVVAQNSGFADFSWGAAGGKPDLFVRQNVEVSNLVVTKRGWLYSSANKSSFSAMDLDRYTSSLSQDDDTC